VSVDFTFDGRPMTAQAGQTVGAALLAEGIRSWRTTRVTGRPRGLFCGIGVCFDCLVTVNDEPNVRACLAVVTPGDVVRTQVGNGRDSLRPRAVDRGDSDRGDVDRGDDHV
jgi:predicted molibdopterin-dependent oxidoreductase YjgC